MTFQFPRKIYSVFKLIIVLRAHLATRRDAALLPKLTHSPANSHNKINKTWSEGLFFSIRVGKKTAATESSIEEPQKRVRDIFY